ncbi:hypothetical protein H6P81_005245 [Aristolochia fimbriata]|uniref:Myb/SANT-like DNA-binding domain-containing protein n=1 Tax=Aristolochia fimbriata TaxID=158543 RepID=A0AAV7EXG7_ARIFI|nr:hypothetical protein H6P81_005245 [Aristolochia fimbriata]
MDENGIKGTRATLARVYRPNRVPDKPRVSATRQIRRQRAADRQTKPPDLLPPDPKFIPFVAAGMEDDDSAGEDRDRRPDGGNDRDRTSIAVPVPSQRPPQPISASAAGDSASGKTVTLALPIQGPRAGGGGGGREDCWSEGATEVLIDAWEERYLQLTRGNLKHDHWREVADAVTSRENYGKAPKTDVQCKNRIDTLKKKYKVEKAKVESGKGSSTWIFFQKLDRLVGGSASASKAKSSAMQPTLQPTLQPTVAKLIFSVPTKARSLRQIEANSDDSSEGFPPEMVNGKKRKLKVGNGTIGDSTRELSRAIENLGKVYEKVERAKLKQAVEMEKQRMGFLRELESQRMQFYVKTQMEIGSLDS